MQIDCVEEQPTYTQIGPTFSSDQGGPGNPILCLVFGHTKLLSAFRTKVEIIGSVLFPPPACVFDKDLGLNNMLLFLLDYFIPLLCSRRQSIKPYIFGT